MDDRLDDFASEAVTALDDAVMTIGVVVVVLGLILLSPLWLPWYIWRKLHGR